MAKNRALKNTSKTKAPKEKTRAKKSRVKSESKETKPTKNEKESQLEPHEEFLKATRKFLTDIDCAREMFNAVVPVLKQQNEELSKESKKAVSFLESKLQQKDKGPVLTPNKIWQLINEIRRLEGMLNRIFRTNKMFRRQSIVLLVSCLDEHVAEILRISYRTFPERLKNRNKSLNYDEFVDARSINEIRDRFIESEIDTLLRKSHLDQLDYLDKHFKIEIKEKFSSLANLAELVQRRHLFVHSGGVINRHYLEACQKSGYPLSEDQKRGKELQVSEDYFNRSAEIVYELGLYIAQSIIRQFFPNNIGIIDSTLLRWGFDHLLEERWEFAAIVFQYGMDLPDKYISNDLSRRLFVMNRAIAYKESGKRKKMHELLKSVDWSAASARFHLVREVLLENFDEAEQIMDRLGKDEVTDQDFQIWPAFRNFRETEQFIRGYKKRFGKDFQPEIPQPTD